MQMKRVTKSSLWPTYDEKSHKELYVADLQATTPPSNADEKGHKELYVADLQSYRPQP